MIDHCGIKIRGRELLAKGHVTHASDRVERIYILEAGLIVRERSLENGVRQIVGMHVVGDICGLDALIGGRSHFDMRALSPVSWIPIDRKDLAAAARSSNELSVVLQMELAREAAIAAAWIINLGLRPAFQRIVHLACELAARQHAARDDFSDQVEWPGTQADLAAAMGLSVVHVNRTLNRLVREQVLSDGRRTIFRGLTKLNALASFDPSFLAFHGQRLGALLLSRTDEPDSDRPDLRVPPPPLSFQRGRAAL